MARRQLALSTACLLWLAVSQMSTPAFAQVADLTSDEDQVTSEPVGSLLDAEKQANITSQGAGTMFNVLFNPKPKALILQNFIGEMALVVLLLVYLLNIFVGRRANTLVARAFVKAFCKEGGAIEKNFSLVGTGHTDARSKLMKESASEYKLYASGRRHCISMLATIVLKSRQDLLALFLGLLFPQDDRVDIEVVMSEASMPPMVLAVATKKLIKAMLKEDGGEDDVRKLAHKVEVNRERAAVWPSDKLIVYAEHSALFNDIITDYMLEQVFSRTAFEEHGKYFRQLHFTSENSYGPPTHRHVLRFSFNLPPREHMEELTKLMSAVGVFIDIVGNYKLTPELRKRAEKVRQDLEKKELKDNADKRAEALEERRMAKRADELEKMRRMTPDQREKYEARQQKIEQRRQQKKYTRKG